MGSEGKGRDFKQSYRFQWVLRGRAGILSKVIDFNEFSGGVQEC